MKGLQNKTMKLIQLPKITDGRGNLSFFENKKNIPFKIKSVNLLNICNTDDQYEFKENKNTKFFFVALSGSCLFKNSNADDCMNGVFLKNANKGLYIDESTHCTLSEFAENTVVLVVSSTEKFNVRKI